jgi:hypothetical protein
MATPIDQIFYLAKNSGYPPQGQIDYMVSPPGNTTPLHCLNLETEFIKWNQWAAVGGQFIWQKPPKK